MAKNKAAKTKAADEGSMLKLLRDIVVILILVLGIHSCVAKPFYIPSDSMMPILRNGDRLIVSKYPYGWSYASVSFHLAPKKPGRWFGKLPERGDIVVLEHPVTRVDYIKRVIGLPGDTIELRGGALIINGKPIKREVQPMLSVPVDANMPGSDSSLGRFVTRDAVGKAVLELPIVRETLPGGATFDTIDMGPGYLTDDYGPITVPADHLFLMGDNRDGSADSRVPVDRKGLGGPVPFDAIAGRAEIISFSTDGTAEWYNPLSWFEALRPGRAGTNLRPERQASKN
ncbi:MULTISPECIES: signal peptidase I [Sphingopyxis]|uniref:signal peptidase I n=1 Tax=Sphingopyxis TaxID=165697 RepID=UPI0002D17498|nr:MULTISPECIES: signal peptidase I [Sphingopyxis]ENY80239.1 signal peptidase I [Sphingopyxis sp. MC1]KTE73691.1 S26 family signal peptidase [Sphingopyxis sp. A083]MBN8805587.1 signal peptidase I [Sphingopyxis terrae]MDX8358761.1 signal peptidase I [Sphingopyxis terrae]